MTWNGRRVRRGIIVIVTLLGLSGCASIARLEDGRSSERPMRVCVDPYLAIEAMLCL